MKRTLLSEIKEGEYAKIINIENNGDIRRRFMDLGLVKGTLVRCVLAPHNGMKAYNVRGAVIAIRRNDARYIEVEVPGCEG